MENYLFSFGESPMFAIDSEIALFNDSERALGFKLRFSFG